MKAQSIKTPSWNSRWTFVASAVGLAFGLGHFWRFGALAEEHGGSVFILAYLVFVLLVAYPVLVAEMAIGRRARANPFTGVARLKAEASLGYLWYFVAAFAFIAALVLLAYLVVFGGMALHYGELHSMGKIQALSVDAAAEQWRQLLADYELLHRDTLIFIALAAGFSSLGVKKGLGRVLRITVPLMFIFLAILLYLAWAQGDFRNGVYPLLEWRVSDFSWDSLLWAFSEALFTLGVGTFAVMAYGAYIPGRRSIGWQATWVLALDLLALALCVVVTQALLASQAIDPGSGPALLFIAMPYTFGQLFFGDIFGGLFFALVTIAGLSTAVALMEPAVAWLSQRRRLPRPLAALFVGSAVYGLSLPVLMGFGAWQQWRFLDIDILHWYDLLAGGMLIPLIVFSLCLLAAWRLPEGFLRPQFGRSSGLLFWLWRALLRYIAPPVLLAGMLVILYIRLSQ